MSSPIQGSFNRPSPFALAEPVEVSDEIYSQAKQIFIDNRGTISTKELKEKLNVNHNVACTILDKLKLDVRPEIIQQWAAR